MAKAVAVFTGMGDSGVTGVVEFQQHSEESATSIKGFIEGPGFKEGEKRGFAINTYGDLSGENKSGLHFNPYGKNHGAPSAEDRMVGSLGNVQFGAKGRAEVALEDLHVKLIGPRSVIGRSIAVYENEDDLGKGGSALSLVNGNKGKVVAVGVIGIASSS